MRLANIPSPPKRLFYLGTPPDELLKRPSVAIVGSRKMSAYGQLVTQKFAYELGGQGLVIISGLALGVDAAAHRAALDSHGLCLAVLPGPLDRIVPATNYWLAQEILERGGTLVSEYAPGEVAYRQNFIARNRIMSGLAQAVLITEAGEGSGTLHTAKFALDQGREVLAVPGNISSPGSIGVNNLIKSSRAQLTDRPDDVLNALGLEHHSTPAAEIRGGNHNEQLIINLILEGVTDGDDLLERSRLEIGLFNQALTMLEIAGKIRGLGGNSWALS